MRIHEVELHNYRSYKTASLTLAPRRNIIVGENAQGKTNFLEAIELAATGRAQRAKSEGDLIRSGEDAASVKVVFEANGLTEHLQLTIRANKEKRLASGEWATERKMTVNGVSQKESRLAIVSFKSSDLSLVRGGPKFRRDWLDDVCSLLFITFPDVLRKYAKVIAQRNRLLKTIAEKGKLSVGDQDSLKVWDQQASAMGAKIIKRRAELIKSLLPRATDFQRRISDSKEELRANYLFKGQGQQDESSAEETAEAAAPVFNADHLNDFSESEIGAHLMDLFKQHRFEEIGRKQTLFGPHRDDVDLLLNDVSATSFASQGQQRSLVLALKLAELELVSESLSEAPVLLLDDVLAELDLKRQALLMSNVDINDMQTLITTTHVDGFREDWLAGALFFEVSDRQIAPADNYSTKPSYLR